MIPIRGHAKVRAARIYREAGETSVRRGDNLWLEGEKDYKSSRRAAAAPVSRPLERRAGLQRFSGCCSINNQLPFCCDNTRGRAAQKKDPGKEGQEVIGGLAAAKDISTMLHQWGTIAATLGGNEDGKHHISTLCRKDVLVLAPLRITEGHWTVASLVELRLPMLARLVHLYTVPQILLGTSVAGQIFKHFHFI